MQLNNMTSLREMLEQLSTEQLDEMLQKELHKDQIDDHAVRLIMRILREREEDRSVEMTQGVEQAWMKYQRDVAAIEEDGFRRIRTRGWVLRAASIAAVFCLIVLIFPQQADAETFWERLTRWTESIVEFFGPKDDEARIEEYEFKTDSPGLQQVYDAVVELGITDPVVPMWLPEGYELVELKESETPRKRSVHSRFFDGKNEVVFELNSSHEEKAHGYFIDDSQYEHYEQNGMKFYIAKNDKKWIAIWTDNKVECILVIDCQEDILHRTLRSIFTMEDI